MNRETETQATDAAFQRHGVWLMLGSVLLFTANTLIIRALSLHFPAADGWLATWFRGLTGMLVVWVFFSGGRGLRMGRLFSNPLLMARGVLGALTIAAFYITVVKLGPSRAVVLNLTYPMFGSIIAAVWLKERMSRAAGLWMVAGFAGLVLFLSDAGGLWRVSFYDGLALAGAFGAGWVVVLIRRLKDDEHPSTIYASQALCSLALAAPMAGGLVELPMMAWAGLAFAGVIVAGGQLVMTRAYQIMPVGKGSATQMTLPLATSLGGYLLFGETFEPVEILGALVTLFATWRVLVSR